MGPLWPLCNRVRHRTKTPRHHAPQSGGGSRSFYPCGGVSPVASIACAIATTPRYHAPDGEGGRRRWLLTRVRARAPPPAGRPVGAGRAVVVPRRGHDPRARPRVARRGRDDRRRGRAWCDGARARRADAHRALRRPRDAHAPRGALRRRCHFGRGVGGGGDERERPCQRDDDGEWRERPSQRDSGERRRGARHRRRRHCRLGGVWRASERERRGERHDQCRHALRLRNRARCDAVRRRRRRGERRVARERGERL